MLEVFIGCQNLDNLKFLHNHHRRQVGERNQRLVAQPLSPFKRRMKPVGRYFVNPKIAGCGTGEKPVDETRCLRMVLPPEEQRDELVENIVRRRERLSP